MLLSGATSNVSNISTGNSSYQQPSGFFSPEYHQAWLIWISLTGVTAVLGTFANLVLVLASITVREIRRISSAPLIIHCTILDLYMSAVVAPLGSILAYLGPSVSRTLPPQFCQYFGLGFYSIYALHAWAACVLAFQRIVATFFPHSYRHFNTRKAMIVMFVFPWVVVLTINVLNVLEIGSKTAASSFAGGCTTMPAGKHGSTMWYHAFSLYAPSAAMGGMYVAILAKTAYEIGIKSTSDAPAKKNQKTLVIARRFNISKMLFVSFLWFCLAMYPLPIAIAYFPNAFNKNILVHLVVRYLAASYGCLNPILYIATSKLYLVGLVKFLTCNRSTARDSQIHPHDIQQWHQPAYPY